MMKIKNFKKYILIFCGYMKNIGKDIKILKIKKIEIYSLSFSRRMKKIEKLSNKLKRKIWRYLF